MQIVLLFCLLGRLALASSFVISIFCKAFQRSVVLNKVLRLALETRCFRRLDAGDIPQQGTLEPLCRQNPVLQRARWVYENE